MNVMRACTPDHGRHSNLRHSLSAKSAGEAGSPDICLVANGMWLRLFSVVLCMAGSCNMSHLHACDQKRPMLLAKCSTQCAAKLAEASSIVVIVEASLVVVVTDASPAVLAATAILVATANTTPITAGAKAKTIVKHISTEIFLHM